MSSRSPLLEARAREAALIKHRGVNDPEVIKARAERRKLSAEQHIERLLAQTPPLTAEEKLHLTRLLSADVRVGDLDAA